METYWCLYPQNVGVCTHLTHSEVWEWEQKLLFEFTRSNGGQGNNRSKCVFLGAEKTLLPLITIFLGTGWRTAVCYFWIYVYFTTCVHFLKGNTIQYILQFPRSTFRKISMRIWSTFQKYCRNVILQSKMQRGIRCAGSSLSVNTSLAIPTFSQLLSAIFHIMFNSQRKCGH